MIRKVEILDPRALVLKFCIPYNVYAPDFADVERLQVRATINNAQHQTFREAVATEHKGA